jgi:hypothetical protein
MDNIIACEARENTNLNTIYCATEDFICAKNFIDKQTSENKYGIVISNPILIGENNGVKHYKYIFSNLIKTYTGENLLKPFAEWEDYLEQVTIYNETDINFYKENFVSVYESLRSTDYEEKPKYYEI